MRGLGGKAVVVTGGASGIGRASVQRFVDEDAEVVVLDRDTRGLESLARELPTVTTIEVDIGDEAALARVFASLPRPAAVLVNNAGISSRDAASDCRLSDWRRVLDVNLIAAFHAAQLAAARMRELGGGVIINMGSVSGMVGMPGYAAYNASKAAIIELTRTLALEWAPTIRVVSVCPGYVLTPMQRREYTDEMLAEIDARIPLGRHGRPEEIAALVAFIASDEAPFITGSSIVIDGGETAGGLASR